MSTIDWAIVVFFVVGITAIGLICNRYMRSVADWLVAGRGIGRYLGIVADTGQATGVITIIAWMQATYGAGPSYWWLMILTFSLGMVLAVTGWGIYRLRETKVLTINELIERRFSRRLRITAGIICFISGVINMGIFPVVGGRFLVYFCGMPLAFELFGLTFSTVAVVTAVLLAVAVLLCLVGGQVSVVITDFLQTAVLMIMYLVIGILIYRVVTWDEIRQVYLSQPNPNELVNPVNKTATSGFNVFFYFTIAFSLFYNRIVWAPNTIRGQSAKDPNEAKIMILWSYLRVAIGVGLLCFAGVACFAYMNLPVFAEQAAEIQAAVSSVDNVTVQKQMIVPVFLARFMPIGVMGLFVAGMLAAFISTNDTYIMSWAGVFIQDVVMPLRKKRLEPKQHIWLLRGAVIGIALAIYLFGIFYRETSYIIMFMLLTFAIYTSGAGVVILGALYWRRATNAGAWAAMITGTAIPITAIIFGQSWPHSEFLLQFAEKFPLNGAQITLLANVASIAVFILVSLLSPHVSFDLDALLHRKDGTNVEVLAIQKKTGGNWFLRHFYHILWVVAIALTGAIIITAIYNLTHDVAPASWLSFWKYWLFIMFFWSVPCTFWLIGGGIRDLYRLIKYLVREKVDVTDDGFVQDK